MIENGERLNNKKKEKLKILGWNHFLNKYLSKLKSTGEYIGLERNKA